MKIIYNRHIPFKGFLAINLFGTLFVRQRKVNGKYVNPELSWTTINHESIHTEQMKELWYIPFYILYVIFWIFNLFRYGFDNDKAYLNICFEKEAYGNQSNLDYIKSRKRHAWTKYF